MRGPGDFLVLAVEVSVAILAADAWSVSGVYALRETRYRPPSPARASCVTRAVISARSSLSATRWVPTGGLGSIRCGGSRELTRRAFEQQAYFASAEAAAPDFATFVDGETERIRSVPQILVGLTGSGSRAPNANLGDRVEAAIAEGREAVLAAPDQAAIRVANRGLGRRTWQLLVGFLLGSDWHPLGHNLLHYVSCGTSSGLLPGLLLPIDLPELQRFSLGAAIGGCLGILLWQRSKVDRLAAAYVAIVRPRGQGRGVGALGVTTCRLGRARRLCGDLAPRRPPSAARRWDCPRLLRMPARGIGSDRGSCSRLGTQHPTTMGLPHRTRAERSAAAPQRTDRAGG